MKIVIAGGSGQVGTILARHWHREGHEVGVLSRRAGNAVPWKVTQWDGRTAGEWCAEIDGADVVINLAGRSVNCRYTAGNRREIMASRVESTRAVGTAIASARHPPRVWLQASTATIYAHRFDADNDEATGILGGEEADAPETWRFSIDVAKAWERALDEAETPATRKVTLRSAMTMSPDSGGIFATLLGLIRCGLGGPVAGGRQFVSWIQEEDFVRTLEWLIDHPDLAGPVNRRARSTALRRVHSRIAGGVGDAGWVASDQMDGRNGHVAAADGIGAGTEKPSRGAAAIDRVGICVSVSDMARSCARPLRALAETASAIDDQTRASGC